MFELASRLVGVYKVNHMVSPPARCCRNDLGRRLADQREQTKSVTIENRDYIVPRA